MQFQETCARRLGSGFELTCMVWDSTSSEGNMRIAVGTRDKIVQVLVLNPNSQLQAVFSVWPDNTVPKSIAFADNGCVNVFGRTIQRKLHQAERWWWCSAKWIQLSIGHVRVQGTLLTDVLLTFFQQTCSSKPEEGHVHSGQCHQWFHFISTWRWQGTSSNICDCCSKCVHPPADGIWGRRKISHRGEQPWISVCIWKEIGEGIQNSSPLQYRLGTDNSSGCQIQMVGWVLIIFPRCVMLTGAV